MRINKNRDFSRSDYESLKISDLKSMCDYWFRQYVLKKSERRGGKYLCPIKNKWYPEDKMHMSHFVDRAIMKTRYDEDNVNLISQSSNVWDAQVMVEGYKSKHHKEYAEWLCEKKVEKLLSMSQEICIFAREDYIEMIEKFRK